MKVLFAGPSLYGVDLSAHRIEVRPPAAAGDVVRALRDGATAIAIVDGLYGDRAAVWHKEILHALDKGAAVLGGASLGALRAAECHSFGMLGVGLVFSMYVDGSLDDDAAVAQLHAPPELGCMPLTEALVNALATIGETEKRGLTDAEEASALAFAARALHFRRRTYKEIAALAASKVGRGPELLAAMSACRIDVKRSDAIRVAETLVALPPGAGTKLGRWNTRITHRFGEMLAPAHA